MDNNILKEEEINHLIQKILKEEAGKISRAEYNKINFKLDEFSNSLGETFKELRKFEEAVPSELENITKSRITSINGHLVEIKKIINQLNEKIKTRKKSNFSQNIIEKKK
jgi:hypothetical protein